MSVSVPGDVYEHTYVEHGSVPEVWLPEWYGWSPEHVKKSMRQDTFDNAPQYFGRPHWYDGLSQVLRTTAPGASALIPPLTVHANASIAPSMELSGGWRGASLAEERPPPSRGSTFTAAVPQPAISLQEPFGSMLLDGAKHMESRSRPLLREFEGCWIAVRLGSRPWDTSRGTPLHAERPRNAVRSGTARRR